MRDTGGCARAWRDRFHRLTGLRILPQDGRAAVLATILAVIGVTGFVVLLDAMIFRAHLSASYLEAIRQPLGMPTFVAVFLSAIEEVKFRLVLMTLLAAIAVQLQGRLTAIAAMVVIAAAQFANAGEVVMADPLYATLRFWLMGSVWGWLYWRHGWLAALAGHMLVHPVLDPLLKLAIP